MCPEHTQAGLYGVSWGIAALNIEEGRNETSTVLRVGEKVI